MSEPTVVGIPVGIPAGGAVAERAGRGTTAVRDAVPPTVDAAQPREGKPARKALPGVPPATEAGQPHEDSPARQALPSPLPATNTSQPREGLPDLAGTAHIASTASPGLPPATDSTTSPPPCTPSPIFHLIGEPTAPELPAATPESHIEVGVQGHGRVCTPAPPKPAGAPADVRHPGRVLAYASVAALVVGSGFLVRALTLADPVPPPVPPAWAGRTVGAVGHRAAPLGYARPTRITIARVGIHADVLALGLTPDGAVGVPPAKEPLTAAWYDRGPAPGQAGPAVITGHVDSRFAPGHRAAFYELGAVRPGDDVDVTRADKRVAVFRVDSVALVPKAGFPTREVYGPTRYAALRLITCGGRYDRRTGYADNVIVYAHLVGSR
ncbi:hypothetical protein ABH926_000250 [Catenulispora sp. GP43]|uniref:class F sortase n=1 Tax=Catenulispora sp. GP43 TaxID=3156263 RepID=UPI003511263E